MATKHHEIEITVNGKHVLHPKPMPEIAIDDTVRYFCNSDGDLSIAFPGLSPFELDAKQTNTRVSGGEKLTVRNDGKFSIRCRFKPKGEDEIGWPTDPAAGADVVIKKKVRP